MSKSVVKITCPSCQKPFDFILPMKMPRSNPQNNWFHACCEIIGNELGDTKETIKQMLKDEYLSEAHFIDLGDGFIKPIRVRKDTSKLKTDEFAAFMEQVLKFAAEQGISLPIPPQKGDE